MEGFAKVMVGIQDWARNWRTNEVSLLVSFSQMAGQGRQRNEGNLVKIRVLGK